MNVFIVNRNFKGRFRNKAKTNDFLVGIFIEKVTTGFMVLKFQNSLKLFYREKISF